ncbi:hypothetical protein K4K61_012493 [Colletotrichum sp. SAR11_59]|nr:hypothetical protein K4K61_012493 [Colletotrichum sp. SAR11_59]
MRLRSSTSFLSLITPPLFEQGTVSIPFLLQNIVCADDNSHKVMGSPNVFNRSWPISELLAQWLRSEEFRIAR